MNKRMKSELRDMANSLLNSGEPTSLTDADLKLVGIDRKRDIHPGDLLRPDPRWNETSGNPNRRLPKECEVLRVEHGRACQTGTLVTVRDVGGKEQTLDSGWFIMPETAQTGRRIS